MRKKKSDVLRDVLEPKRESQEHPSNSKSPGERKKRFRMRQVCAGASNLPPDAIKVHKCTLHIYTQTHSYHISQNGARERERGGGREKCIVRREMVRKNSARLSSVTSALKPARRAPASHVWFVYQKTSRRSQTANKPLLFTQLHFICLFYFILFLKLEALLYR